MRTAEFISPKHPDKLCDIISDTILDKHLEKDPYTQCDIQTFCVNDSLYIVGEIISDYVMSDVEMETIVYDIFKINNVIIKIQRYTTKTNGVTKSGIFLGYATKETANYLPFEYYHARELNRFIYNEFPYAGKTQITINGDWVSVVVSFENTNETQLEEIVRNYFSNTDFYVDKIFCNPNGIDWKSVSSSGKQIVLDNYGPRIPIGGNSYSGKDGNHIDRCGGYMARRIAVDALEKYGLQYALVELSYVKSNDYPIQARIKGNDSGINVETGLQLFEVKDYDLSPNAIVDFLELRTPIYAETSKWGHMGNNFNWK